MTKRLYRSRDERIIWGICGGLGKYFNIDPVFVRVIAVLSLLFAGWGIVAYIVFRFIIPLETEESASQPILTTQIEFHRAIHYGFPLSRCP